MTTAFYIPTVNLMGAGCLKDAADNIQAKGFKKGLIVTDKILNQIGVVKKFNRCLTSAMSQRRYLTVPSQTLPLAM